MNLKPGLYRENTFEIFDWLFLIFFGRIKLSLGIYFLVLLNVLLSSKMWMQSNLGQCLFFQWISCMNNKNIFCWFCLFKGRIDLGLLNLGIVLNKKKTLKISDKILKNTRTEGSQKSSKTLCSKQSDEYWKASFSNIYDISLLPLSMTENASLQLSELKMYFILFKLFIH